MIVGEYGSQSCLYILPHGKFLGKYLLLCRGQMWKDRDFPVVECREIHRAESRWQTFIYLDYECGRFEVLSSCALRSLTEEFPDPSELVLGECECFENENFPSS